MNKKTSLFYSFLLISCFALAQTETASVENKSTSAIEKGTFYIGASTGLNTINSTVKTLGNGIYNSTLSTSASPSFGYFPINNLLIGVQFDYNLQKSNYEYDDPFRPSTTKDILKYRENLFSIFSKYYFGSKRLKPFVGFRGGFGHSLYDQEVTRGDNLYSDVELKDKLIIIEGEVGLTYFLTNRISLDAGFSFIKSGVNFDDAENSISSNIGFSIFLGNEGNNLSANNELLSDFKINKGTVYIGSSSNLIGQRIFNKQNSDDKYYTLNISQSAGYFIVKNLMIGLNFQYDYSKFSRPARPFNGVVFDAPYNEKSQMTTLSFYSQYFIGNGKLKPFVGLEAGAGISKYNVSWPPLGNFIIVDTPNKSNSNLLTAKATLGASYFINSRVSIDGSVGYGNIAPRNERAQYYFDGNVGLSFYLGKNRISN
tara:strand:+ start:861 stop:2141 length:1281 start_codon:yes stop_codon:yes gene_type:complete